MQQPTSSFKPHNDYFKFCQQSQQKKWYACDSTYSLPHSLSYSYASLSCHSSVSYFTYMFKQNHASNIRDTCLQESSTTLNLQVTRIRDQNWTRSRTGRRDLQIWRRSHNLSYFERGIIASKARCPPHQVSWYDNLPYPSSSSHILLIYTCRTRNNKCWIRRDFIQRPYLSSQVKLFG